MGRWSAFLSVVIADGTLVAVTYKKSLLSFCHIVFYILSVLKADLKG
ncbi:hypothetical protein S7335_3853 [Synechococcus sp. PCC 7335]|nr:hypothetical protein S7335_3853 [Synechococcus sp. PCC 7335]